MAIKTTINIKESLFAKLSAIALEYGITKSFIINYLVKKTIKHYSQKARLLQTVQYQGVIDDIDSWHCMHVTFQPDVYEKALDLRKLSKLSVSFFIARAFDKYLDELIHEMKFGSNGDNYDSNYLLFQTKTGYVNLITLIWGKIEEEKLQKLKEIHKH